MNRRGIVFSIIPIAAMITVLFTQGTQATHPTDEWQSASGGTLHYNGMVGIGIQDPLLPLHINSQIPYRGWNQNVLLDSPSPSIALNDSDNPNTGVMLRGGNGIFSVFTRNGSGQFVSTDERLTVRTDGKIGVGEKDPAETLDVAGAIAVNSQTVIDAQGRFVGDMTNLAATPTGSAGGDLIGNYPNPQVDPSTIVHSLNGLQGDVSLVSGSTNVSVSPTAGNAVEITVSDNSSFNAGFEILTVGDSYDKIFSTGLNRQPKRLEITMQFTPSGYSRSTWVDIDGDGLGVLELSFRSDSGEERLVLDPAADQIGRYEASLMDAQVFVLEVFNGSDSVRITPGQVFGQPTLPGTIAFTWVAQ